LIGVLSRWRRRGLAVALLAQAFGVLYDRGLFEATCEVDQTNTASNALMMSLGARRTGGEVELVRRRTPSP
jgi:ribosomal protein S18 acetylase RimI-like enzyme